MTKKTTKMAKMPSIDDVADIAKAATQQVRDEAIANGQALPVWQDGLVVYIDPKTGERSDRDDALKVWLNQQRT